MKKVLLVEGPTDVDFFKALFRKAPVNAEVKIYPPREYGLQNTASTIPKLLDILIPQLGTGDITTLAVVLDADHVSGGGINARWGVLRAKLDDFGYNVPQSPPRLPALGSSFNNREGLPPLGLWLMPDHSRNGMLEDMLIEVVKADADQEALLKHANSVVKKLPNRLFSDFQQCKAVVYSWLAWQKYPGLGINITLSAELLDLNKPPLKGLIKWLCDTFE